MSTEEEKPVYSWYKYSDASDECVIDAFCTRDTSGKPVPFCSLPQNADAVMCKRDAVKQRTLSHFLGCFDDAQCGGRINNNDSDTAGTPFPNCHIHKKQMCSYDKTITELHENCMELREGIMSLEDLDEKGQAKYCFLGKLNNPFDASSSPSYDPCSLGRMKGGYDLCPKSCFNAHCCPGSFAS